MKPKIAETVIDKLRTHTGINLDYYRREFLEKRIELRMKDLDIKSYENYIDYLSHNSSEVDKFLEKFTVNYTYFFRNFEVFERLKEILLFSNRNLKRKIKIWSAPCATGDEPYSLGILMEEIKKIYSNFPEYTINASDIDKNALSIAKKGVYSDKSLQEVPNNYQMEYFNQKVGSYGVEYRINEKIKSKVKFVEEDIIEKHKNKEKYDLIFCRNLIIYIDRQSREKLISILENHLLEGGLLILGKIEAIKNEGSQLKLIDGKNHIYVKNDLKYSDLFKPLSSDKEKTEVLAKEQVKYHRSTKVPLEANLKPKKPKSVPENVIKSKITNLHPPKGLKIYNKVLSKEESPILPIDIIEEEKNDKVDFSSDFQKKLNQIRINKHRLKEREKKIVKKEFEMIQKERELVQREEELNERYQQIEKIETKLQQRFKERIEREKQLKDQILQLERILHHLRQKIKKPESLSSQDGVKSVDIADLKKNNSQSIENITVLEPNDYIFEKDVFLSQNEMILIGEFPELNYTKKVKVDNIGSDFLLIIYGNISDITSIIRLSSFSVDMEKNENKFQSVLEVIKTVYKKDTKLDSYVIGGMFNMLKEKLSYSESIKLIRGKLRAVGISIKKEDVGGFSDRTFSYDIMERTPYIKKSWEFDYRIFS